MFNPTRLHLILAPLALCCASGVAHAQCDVWQPLGSGVTNWTPKLIAYNGDLIAGGDFVTAGGQTVNYIGRWNGSIWQSLGSGMDSSVYGLTIYKGELIAGGIFGTAGGHIVNGIAAWNGQDWHSLGGA